MSKSLLFIPDISGFTKFVQTTEVEHSQHVIAELLEVLIDANTQSLKLAEVEGDALFFYKEKTIPSQEKLLAQVETMYTAFYSHLKMMEANRICPCNACASAPNLELKIVLHSGDLQFMTVQGNRKPFGEVVIQAHRLLKNSIDSDNYVLISNTLSKEIGIDSNYNSHLFRFRESKDSYDGIAISYLYAEVEAIKLKLNPFALPKIVEMNRAPNITITAEFATDAYSLFEMLTNYRYRSQWDTDVTAFRYKENHVSRVNTEHVCVIGGNHLNFTTVIKKAPPHQLVYGELTNSLVHIDQFYKFYIVEPINDHICRLTFEIFWNTKNLFQKTIVSLMMKRKLKQGMITSINKLQSFASSKI